MIAESKRAAVVRLSKQNISPAEIQRTTGVAMTTIKRIARQLPVECRQPKPKQSRYVPTCYKAVDPRTAQRCPGCGGMVVMPCLECASEGEKAYRRVLSANCQYH